MPDVNPSGSSHPPVSGNVEDPQSLQNHHQSNEQVPYKVNCTGTSEDTSDRSVLLPKPDHKVETREGNETPAGSSTEDLSVHETNLNKSRNEVIKEISISSTTFIGPVCRPQPAIEDELSEFYKELEQINNQDAVDGDQGSYEEIPQACIPSVKPSSRKETHVNEHRNTYRPYPQANSHAAYRREDRNTQRLTQSPCNMTNDDPNPFKDSQQWQPPTLRLPHGPPSFRFHRSQPVFFPPKPNLCSPFPHFEAQGNHLSHPKSSTWSSWEENQFTTNERSDVTGSVKRYGSDTSDWRDYEGCHEDQQQCNLVLILMRGLPGSGKSTLARELVSTGPSGLILSTDDYFYHRTGYFFQPTQLGAAHEWNQSRARKAMTEGRSPVIIDNTNVMAWEMKPYVAIALERGYSVEFVEPHTRWKCDPVELERRNKHGVLRDSIAKMLDRFDFPISVDVVMRSSEPSHKSKEHHSNRHR